MIKDIESRQH